MYTLMGLALEMVPEPSGGFEGLETSPGPRALRTDSSPALAASVSSGKGAKLRFIWCPRRSVSPLPQPQVEIFIFYKSRAKFSGWGLKSVSKAPPPLNAFLR